MVGEGVGDEEDPLDSGGGEEVANVGLGVLEVAGGVQRRVGEEQEATRRVGRHIGRSQEQVRSGFWWNLECDNENLLELLT